MPSHPGAAPAGGPELPILTRDLWPPVLVTWLATIAIAVVYLVLGRALDAIRAGRDVVGAELALALGAALVAGVATAWVARAAAGRQAEVEQTLRHRVVRAFLAAGPPDVTRVATGRLVSTATDATERVATYRGSFLGPALASVTVPVVVLVVVGLAIDPLTAVVLAVVVPVAPAIIVGFQRLFRASSGAYRVASRRLAGAFLDAIQGLTTLRLLGAGEQRGRDLAAASERVRQAVMRLLRGNQVVILVADAAFWLGFVALTGVLAMNRVEAGAITPGQGVALVLLATLLLEPLDRIGQFFYIGLAGRASEREAEKLAAQRPVVREPAPSATVPLRTEAGIAVDLDAVSFAYPDGTSVVTNLDLHLAAGERVAVVGRSGAGKSTLADLLQAVWLPQAGTVRLGGVATGAMTFAQTRAVVAVVAQRTYLFTGTIAQNLRLAAPDATDDELWAALDVAALADDVRSLDAGLATPVGERGLSLSGGQAQRLAIARAVLRDAPLLILDEPTAQVDLGSERAIVTALERASQGRTVLTITHRASAIGTVDRVLTLRDGRLADAPDAVAPDSGADPSKARTEESR